ncbi:tyrosyl-DNA phosphodiesterase [Nemania serpens]|nr:tyrosyl-DNA phosphodiesterase [Nemania serpens]
MAQPPIKRRRPSSDGDDNAQDAGDNERATLSSLSRPISPPPRTKKVKVRARIASPFRLTSIRDLSDDDNIGAVSLNDLVGDPLIAELWDFNYLHDIDFLINHLDEDTRALTKIHVVHGFWKKEDPNRILLHEQARQYENVTLHAAWMPEPFGTHHTKMLVLFRHDDTAQVIIHTANMIAKDWTNMTNGVWMSPLLPKLQPAHQTPPTRGPVGSGSRFKSDLLRYLWMYDKLRHSLVEDLKKYDFSAVRGALIASVPGSHAVEQGRDTTSWGWHGLRETLKNVPTQPGPSDIAVQISSIASLGPKDDWLQRTLFDSLAASRSPSQQELSPSRSQISRPNFKIIFPTPDEIRRSLNGYASGGSIHTKITTPPQEKQFRYMRPLLHHWANDSPDEVSGSTSASASGDGRSGLQDAGRGRAAPHIKTYIRYGEKSIDWALLTSANISRQAWGAATNSAGKMRIASWEVGVLVWPALLAGDEEAKMIGTFKTDEPEGEEEAEADDGNSAVVGLRIPYSLPLKKYGDAEVPWVATMDYTQPDWMGQRWVR